MVKWGLYYIFLLYLLCLLRTALYYLYFVLICSIIQHIMINSMLDIFKEKKKKSHLKAVGIKSKCHYIFHMAIII